ncbi:hypothetical protein [Ferviditalea candida]|uniref:hypothetical protein n=1 Tax=Ferviditalea candida TaxID=3108399 RepID=UPI00352D83F8
MGQLLCQVWPVIAKLIAVLRMQITLCYPTAISITASTAVPDRLSIQVREEFIL